MRHLTLISTGGTIEKTYDELGGHLVNRTSIVQRMLRRLRLEDTVVNTLQLMSKDSLDLTDEDRQRIASAAARIAGTRGQPGEADGVVILHGTDTLGRTGDVIHHACPDPAVPIILTGAMRPFELQRSDALQNLTEAIFATAVVQPGVWCVAHGRALRFPGVGKDRSRSTFVDIPPANRPDQNEAGRE